MLKMDRDDIRKNFAKDLESQDTYDTRQAKQRASIKWLLSKAYNNRVPENLREPFYKDHEDQEHVKPQIVHNLANAELYCLAFANIYSDPNYHNLNHGGILQTLARKGIPLPDCGDGPLTETVLIKTTPIKLVAHIAVIEAIMELYTNEVVTPDRVVAAIQRFTHGAVSPSMPSTSEEGLLLWVNQAQSALVRKIALEGEVEPPRFPPIKDVKGLSDGAGLAALVSFYCPEELPWQEIKVPALPTVSDSVHNLCLVHEFSHHSLPSRVCHMMPEDVTYLRGNMKMNLLALLSDLFNVLEIHPVKCVRFPGRELSVDRNSQGVAHKRSLPQPVTGIPDLRSHLSSHSSFTVPKSAGSAGIRKSMSSPYSESCFAGSPDSLDTRTLEDRDAYLRRGGGGEDFVVHRGKNIPTLSSMIAEDPLLPARLRPNKERGNQDSKGEERGEAGRAAGKPTHCDESKRMSYAGRRSRRNSLSEDSQLTLENFGGSQENLHFLGRNPDKDPAILLSAAAAQATRTSAQEARSSGVELIFAGGNDRSASPVSRQNSRKSPSPAPGVMHPTPNVPVRSSQQDARSTAIDRIFADNGYGIEKKDDEKPPHQPHPPPRESRGDSGRESRGDSGRDSRGDPSRDSSMVSLNHVLQHSRQSDVTDGDISGISPLRLEDSPAPRTNGNSEKMTSFAASPNTTTWQMQQRSFPSSASPGMQQVPTMPDENSSTMQLLNIRLKLEEKRRHIESEKKKMELVFNKERQKLGKAAFLQAVTKKENKPEVVKEKVEEGSITTNGFDPGKGDKDMREAGAVNRKWMDHSAPVMEEMRTPDAENIDIDQFQRSMAQMESNICDIDSEMQKLYLQETQLPDERISQQMKDLSQQQIIANYVNQQQKLAAQLAANQSLQNIKQTNLANQTYTTFAGTSPQVKPLSLSQLHHQNTTNSPLNQSPNQFFLHEPKRTTWREQSDQTMPTGSSGFTLHETRVNGGPTPSPRNAVSSPLHARPTPPTKPVVPPRQAPPKPTPPAPTVDDMEPQSICFIGDEEEDTQGRSRIQISSGSRTYRIPSPTRTHAKNPFLQRAPPEEEPEKGFYISFDDEAPPKRPKPPLRGKRNSPKKDRFSTQVIDKPYEEREEDYKPFDDSRSPNQTLRDDVTSSPRVRPQQLQQQINYSPDLTSRAIAPSGAVPYSPAVPARPAEPLSPGVGLVIGNEPDPNAVDEMERKKEKILLLSLQRRQQQEEAKARKEMEAQQRKELEKLKEEDRARKKEEEKTRRAAILEQFKLKKAIEEAEREGKVIDKAELLKLAAPKMRSKPTTTPRPRPKTIHVESGSVNAAMLGPSRGQRGSNNNLADRSHENSVFNRPLRRDHYRGSQDSLAGNLSGRGRPRESPCDDDRGTSPSRSGISNLGRRGSYKTSRDSSEPPVARNRSRDRSQSKYSTYQPVFRNRKSNSLVNLSGSSTDQDSLAYRYGDTDSGLGRATPPRRAPSPGLNRHLTSPSGPGSLPPGLISKRRGFDDGASDISSASSMMDYNGPRLYKQPATKSNRGIMLNAVEYCVFPGVVNKEAKRRVLEEISRSEAKHFLILFRDAGCQFRALYSYCPDTEEVLKLYGTGPRAVNERMFDRFFKYNSGGKCFSQIHTKHLTVTIDAFTIHNSLWQGKKVNLPSKKDMALVI